MHHYSCKKVFFCYVMGRLDGLRPSFLMHASARARLTAWQRTLAKACHFVVLIEVLHVCHRTGGTVIVLGRTGKNFGAGMSGGLAFVYDPDRRLGPLCNEDVAGDLSALESEEVRRDTAAPCSHTWKQHPHCLTGLNNIGMCAKVRLGLACSVNVR